MQSGFIAKHIVSHVVILGDSLSDRGTLDKRYILGFVPIAWLSGLTGKSPDGRFANGYVWSDVISSMLADEFVIRHTEKDYANSAHRKNKRDVTDKVDAILTKPQSKRRSLPDLDVTDIADSIITSRYFKKKFQSSYTLDNDLYVQYRGRDFVRSYVEGGLSAHNYHSDPSINIAIWVSRLILSSLDKKREAMLKHDRDTACSVQQKKKTLVIEWSGANDLITENVAPTNAEADRAVQARMINAEKLIESGYRHFILFNLPDLSLTPSYQGKTAADRKNAHAVCEYFNRQLQAEIEKLQQKYQHLNVSLQVYDVSKVFSAVYEDTLNGTKKFPVHFDKDKLTIPWVDAKNFFDKDHLSPATGYMFWNDVHPSAEMQALLANEFYKVLLQKFIIAAPKAKTARMLCADFKNKIQKFKTVDLCGYITSCCGLFALPLPRIDYGNPLLALVDILKASNEDSRVCTAITELGWLHADGNVNSSIRALREAEKELLKINLQNAHQQDQKTLLGYGSIDSSS